MTDPASTSVFTTLGLNLPLFIAQLVNFGLILLVVWRWVWRPLVKAMDERQEKISKGLQNAEQATKDLQALTVRESQVIATAERSATDIIEAAKQTAEKERRQIMNETNQSLERQLVEARERLKQEREVVLTSIRQEAVGLIMQATERVLGSALTDKPSQALIEEALKDVAKQTV